MSIKFNESNLREDERWSIPSLPPVGRRLETGAVQTRFLLGPSGSGKTHRCVSEARAALLTSADGLPLIFLSPKQATFQVERQLLSDPDLAGYTRLRVLSFERLAQFVLGEFKQDTPELLSDEGRLMVLRALLTKKRDELKLFRATARLRGFAQQLSVLLRELQRFQLSPEELRGLARRIGDDGELGPKLHDLASMLQAYVDWLAKHQLQDEDELLRLATDVLNSATRARSDHVTAGVTQEHAVPIPVVRFAGLWLDGFADLAPQELAFLAALLPHCERATLAFNLDEKGLGPGSWLSPWSLAGSSYRQLQKKLAENPGIGLATEWLVRDSGHTRFAHNPVLAHLERHWSDPQPYHVRGARAQVSSTEPLGAQKDGPAVADVIRVWVCANPEAEATCAARQIRRFIRAGGRYRETAVIVRNLENYFDPVRRVFAAYEIPFFLDRREPVGHHPLAELTRSSLRTIASHWQGEDWFGALKTGLVHPDDTAIDWLENEALARGWQGEDWLRPLRVSDDPELERKLEALRLKLVPAFQQLGASLGTHPSGKTVSESLAKFWLRLDVQERLQEWSARPLVRGKVDVWGLVHTTVWQQLQDWNANVALAFAEEKLSLREWLPILEAGLAAQTVGVIPPALDQVLVGAIDRSRNPDLKLALVLGMNEMVFPAARPEPILLSASDRDRLMGMGVELGPASRRQLAQERYLGYIACTRPQERLVLTCALRDENDQVLNRSPFLDHLQRLFPDLELAGFTPPAPAEAEHVCELASLLLGSGRGTAGVPAALVELPAIREAERLAKELQNAVDFLNPVLAAALYGPTLQTSVSRLEEYASCPFRFLVTSGFHAQERKLFRLDAREQGSFQHEVLARFHKQIEAEKRFWRDLTPKEAQEKLATIANELIPEYQGGLLQATEQSRFTARNLIRSLQSFIGTVVQWMQQYEFNPRAVELAFGIEEKPLPAWEIDLGEGHHLSFRGKIDRIDLWHDPKTGAARCVVIDYKSGGKKLDPLLMAHGIQLQLPAYLNVLRALENPEKVFGAKRLEPAGVFFVNLRGRYAAARSRDEAMDGFKEARALAYQHTGRFDTNALRLLDRRSHVQEGDQFKYRLRKDGELYANCRQALNTAAFQKMLDDVEGHLRRMGTEIYAGRAAPDPYRKGSVTACDQCDYGSVCRLDPWTYDFRVLRQPGAKAGPSLENGKRTLAPTG